LAEGPEGTPGQSAPGYYHANRRDGSRPLIGIIHGEHWQFVIETTCAMKNVIFTVYRIRAVKKNRSTVYQKDFQRHGRVPGKRNISGEALRHTAISTLTVTVVKLSPQHPPNKST